MPVFVFFAGIAVGVIYVVDVLSSCDCGCRFLYAVYAVFCFGCAVVAVPGTVCSVVLVFLLMMFSCCCCYIGVPVVISVSTNMC